MWNKDHRDINKKKIKKKRHWKRQNKWKKNKHNDNNQSAGLIKVTDKIS